jgi:hypothetical protein
MLSQNYLSPLRTFVNLLLKLPCHKSNRPTTLHSLLPMPQTRVQAVVMHHDTLNDSLFRLSMHNLNIPAEPIPLFFSFIN